MSQRRAPSKQLLTSMTVGGILGAAVDGFAQAHGVPLPPGTGEALAAALVGAVHWMQGKGRAPPKKGR